MDKKKKLSVGLGLVLVAAVAVSYVTLEQGQVAEAKTAKIASFNVQVFGVTKSHKENVMNVLTRIAREFDIVLIQEVRDSTGATIPYFVQKINEIPGPKYSSIISKRLGRSTSQESYAYVYNTETVQFIQGSDYVYNDTSDAFEREPYIASFKIGNFDFTLVGIHTKPDDAYNEIGNLTLVVASIQQKNPSEKDIITLGDFNADGTYFKENDNSNPFKASAYNWMITNNMDTMVKTDYTYDRIVILNTTLNHEYETGTAQVFYYDQVYSLNNATLVAEISDHYPVFAKYKTNLPDDD